jgi:glycosyltransferase involved in cell wall biosynthesis
MACHEGLQKIMSKHIINIFFFPNLARGGIERNFKLWIESSEKNETNKNYILSHAKTDEFHLPVYKPNLKNVENILRKWPEYTRVNIIVFRKIARPVIWAYLLRAKGFRFINIIYRANNDPMHWYHEKSIKRCMSEVVKSILLRCYDGVIFNSEELASRCAHYNKNIFVLSNPIEPRKNITFENKSNKLLFVGRNAKQKNIRNLIEAMGRLGPKANLTIIGFSNPLELHIENIEFLEWRENIDFSLYSFIVVPSLYEGSPNALLEGLNNGLIPVLTPFKSGANELLSAYRCQSFISSSFTSEAIAEAILSALESKVVTISQTPDYLSFQRFDSKLDAILND